MAASVAVSDAVALDERETIPMPGYSGKSRTYVLDGYRKEQEQHKQHKKGRKPPTKSQIQDVDVSQRRCGSPAERSLIHVTGKQKDFRKAAKIGVAYHLQLISEIS
eukprot:IDg13586t1